MTTLALGTLAGDPTYPVNMWVQITDAKKMAATAEMEVIGPAA
jgi:hypothetical protein